MLTDLISRWGVILFSSLVYSNISLMTSYDMWLLNLSVIPPVSFPGLQEVHIVTFL